MPDSNQISWKKEITTRVGDVEPSILEELAQHLEARFDELRSYDAVMAEWSAEELRSELARMKQRRAPNTFGSPARPWQGLGQDLRFGLRQLRLNPGFAVVAILSLALGIGANTAVFQLLDAVRLRTLPAENPEELAIVRIANKGSRSGSFVSRFPWATYAMWEQFRDRQQVFSGVFAWGSDQFNLSPAGESRYTRDAINV